MNGWIKLHRKLLDNCIADKPDYLALWVTLLLLASHEESTFLFNNKKEILKPGQLITGRLALAEKTGIAASQVYKILKYLELEHQIEQQKTSRFTLVTIVNWTTYQQKEQQKEQPSNNQVTTGEQLGNTFKNDKKVENEKNDKNIYTLFLNSFNERTGRKYKIIDNKTQRQIDLLIKNGYTIDDWNNAITEALKDKYITGSNDNHKYYLTPEFLSRPAKFESYMVTKPIKEPIKEMSEMQWNIEQVKKQILANKKF